MPLSEEALGFHTSLLSSAGLGDLSFFFGFFSFGVKPVEAVAGEAFFISASRRLAASDVCVQGSASCYQRETSHRNVVLPKDTCCACVCVCVRMCVIVCVCVCVCGCVGVWVVRWWVVGGCVGGREGGRQVGG